MLAYYFQPENNCLGYQVFVRLKLENMDRFIAKQSQTFFPSKFYLTGPYVYENQLKINTIDYISKLIMRTVWSEVAGNQTLL